ncbi:hypothetical protein RQP46_005158 [Phenoliferia psychrophenolica]
MSSSLSLALETLCASLSPDAPSHATLAALSTSIAKSAPTPAKLLSALPSEVLLSLLVASASPALGFVASLVKHCRSEIAERLAPAEVAGRWKKGKAAEGEKWEKVLEQALLGLKFFVRGTDDHPLSAEEKTLVGEKLFGVLPSLLSVPKLRLMLKRRVMDVFEYATEHSRANHKSLAQNKVLGPAVLARILFDASDHPLTERTLELAFRLGRHVASTNSSLLQQWASLVFPAALWRQEKERKEVIERFLGMTLKNFDEESKSLLDVLSARDKSTYQLIPALSLSANSHPFTNSDSPLLSLSKHITYGHPIAFGKETFTAIVTGPPPSHLLPTPTPSKSKALLKPAVAPEKDKEEEDEAPLQQILEVDFAHVDHAELSSSSHDTPGRVQVRLALLRAPSLDSVDLERRDGLEEDEIVFEIESRERGKVEQVFRDRGLICEFAKELDDGLPTPTTSSKKQKQQGPGNISPLSLSPLSESSTHPIKVPLPSLPTKSKLPESTSIRPAAKSTRSTTTTTGKVPPPPKPVPARQTKKAPVPSKAPTKPETRKAPRKALPLPAEPKKAPRVKPVAKRPREVEVAESGPEEDRGGRNVGDSNDGKMKGEFGVEAVVEERSSDGGVKKARRGKVAFDVVEAPAKQPVQSKILAPNSDDLGPGPTHDSSSFSFSTYLPPKPSLEDFSFSNFNPRESNSPTNPFAMDVDGGGESDDDEAAIQVLEAKLAGMTKKERKRVTEMIASQLLEEEESDEAKGEEDVVMEDFVEATVELNPAPVFKSPPPPVLRPSPSLPALVVPKVPAKHRPTSNSRLNSKIPTKVSSKPKPPHSPKPSRVEYANPEDAAVASVLQELSNVVLNQFSARREGGKRSFNASRAAIDMAARKVREELLQNSTEVVETAHATLDLSAKKAKLNADVEAWKARVTAARSARELL